MLYLYHINDMQYYSLENQITIGRASGEIICPSDGRMSGKHAQITFQIIEGKTNLFIEDLGSKNKTIVNRSEIPPHEKIKINFFTLIEIGDQKFVPTDSNSVNIQLLGEMIEKQLKKQVSLVEKEASPPPVEVNPLKKIAVIEAELSEIQNEIS